MTAAATPVAHSQGLFDLDDRIADHWPAFGRHEKSAVTVRQLLSHQAGLAALDHRLSPDQIADQEFLSDLLAEKHLDWKPGTHQGITRSPPDGTVDCYVSLSSRSRCLVLGTGKGRMLIVY